MIHKPKQKKERRRLTQKQKIVRGILLLAFVATILRIFVVTPIKVPDNAMQGGLYPGDYLLSLKVAYKDAIPKTGDLVAFEHPLRPGQKIVRRVVASEGKTVEISGKTVYVNGQPISEFPTTLHSDYRVFPKSFSGRDYSGPVQVPSGFIYVLGDNRDICEDSRNFGCIPVSSVEGKGLFVYLSWAPDPKAPKLESPYIIPAIQLFFYNLVSFPSRVRWDRFFI